MQVTTLQPKKIWQKRIPTLIGLGFLVVALVVGVLFIGKGGGIFAPRATPETTPKNVKLTNITDTTFTVSFLTDSPVKAYIKYGKTENDLTPRFADDRDQLSGTAEPYTSHHITLRGLEPNTTYYYLIGTDEGGVFDNSGAVFKLTTARKAGAPAAAKTIYGSVTAESGSPAAGAIVYLKIDGAGEMSALVTNVGGWAVPLSNARTPDGSAYAQITNETTINLNVQGAKAGQTAQTSVTVADAQPVPTITFGKAVAQATAEPAPTETPTPSASTSGTVVMDTVPANTSSSSARSAGGLNSLLSDASIASGSADASGSGTVVQVTVVDVTDSDKAVVTTTQPTITGKVIPKVKVRIEVHSETAINQEVTSDANGNFEFDISELQETLEPGEHTVTYTYTDPTTGKDVTTTRTFTVAPKSQKLIAVATPTPTPFGSSNPYPIGGATSSATATKSASATKSAATAKPSTSTRSSNPSTSSGMPVTGAIGTTLALVFGGLFFIIAGTWSFWVSSQFAKRDVNN